MAAPTGEVAGMAYEPLPRYVTAAVQAPYIAGYLVNLMLFAIVFSWFVEYWASDLYKRDPLRVKLYFWPVLALASVGAGMNFFEVVWWGTEPRKDIEMIYAYTWVDTVAPLPIAVVAALVQAFLSTRLISFITNKRIRSFYTVFLPLCIVLTFLATTMFSVTAVLYKRGITTPPWGADTFCWLWQWMAVITDGTISVSSCVVMRSKIRNFNQHTDSLLRRLSLLSLQTGSYTSVLAALGAIFSLVYPSSSLYLDITAAFYLPLPSLYAMSLISTLNARRTLQQPSSGSVGYGCAVNANKSRSVSMLVDSPRAQATPNARPGSGPVWPLGFSVCSPTDVGQDGEEKVEVSSAGEGRAPKTLV